MNRSGNCDTRVAAAGLQAISVAIAWADKTVFTGEMSNVRTYGDVAEGAPLLYLNSLMNVSFALNRGDFAKQHAIGCGAEWTVRLENIKR